jgi:hypothetical protein
MITVQQYFGPRWGGPECTPGMQVNSELLLRKVNDFLDAATSECGYAWPEDVDTGTCISGSPPRATMSGDGGFRGTDSKTGGPKSKHRLAQAIDIFDPDNRLDTWISRFETANGGNVLLEKYGLYREHPDDTPGWCHLQYIGPGSGRRTFKP